jgi:hypothetical protein
MAFTDAHIVDCLCIALHASLCVTGKDLPNANVLSLAVQISTSNQRLTRHTRTANVKTKKNYFMKGNLIPKANVASTLLVAQTDDPLVGDIARQYKVNRELHDKTAREWVQRYAK